MRRNKLWVLITIMVLSFSMLVACATESEKKDDNLSIDNSTIAEESSAPEVTEEPTEEITQEPDTSPLETPIVQTIGNVDPAEYEKAVSVFEDVVIKMREDGLVSTSDICVTMDSTSVKVDITFDNDDVDLMICVDSSTNEYTLTFDYDFTWLEGFGPTVNDKDPALYNKDLMVAILSMVSNEPQALFDRIDLDCHSAAGLSQTEWSEIGDCYIKSGEMVVDEYISYNIMLGSN